MAEETKRKNFFTEWLEKLQQESWQLELIISGVAIFALLESKNYISEVYPSIIRLFDEAPELGIVIGVFAYFTLLSGIYISLINLIIHVLIRSLWIGAIGLRYVSGDIDYEQLNYHQKFTNFYKKRIGSFDNYIEKLENFSSILFSYTFLLVFITISIFLYICSLTALSLFLTEVLNINKSTQRIITLFFLLGSLLVAFDFVSLGAFKRIKNKYFATFYFWIYRFFSAATLSFLWRPMLLNFLDQRYTRRLLLLSIPYLLLLAAIGDTEYYSRGFYPSFDFHDAEYPEVTNAESFNARFYDDERQQFAPNSESRLIRGFSLPSKKLKGPLGEIFIASLGTDKFLIKKSNSSLRPFTEDGLKPPIIADLKAGFEEGANRANKEQLIETWRDSIQDETVFNHKRDSLNAVYDELSKDQFKDNLLKIKQIFKNSISLSIDRQTIAPDAISCDFYQHPEGHTKGLLCFFPLDSLSIGRHLLTVDRVKANQLENSTELKDITLDTTSQTIPFIYLGRHSRN